MDATGKKSVLYLDYNAYGKPGRTAVLINNEDISKDLVLNGDKVVPFEKLFPVNEQGVTVYGPYEYHSIAVQLLQLTAILMLLETQGE